MNSPQIWFLVSHPMSAVSFLQPHLKLLSSRYKVRVFANTHEANLLREKGLDIDIEFMPIVRKISLWSDIKSLCAFYLQLRSSRPTVLHTLTPKAGLIGLVAAYLADTPIRVHTFTGQVWVTRRGAIRWLLKSADRFISLLATDLIVDSPSQRKFLIEQGVVDAKKSVVLGIGSICGVDTHRFAPSLISRQLLRDEMGVKNDVLVCLFLGRLNRDKGILDLATAFSKLDLKNHRVELWVVGPDEERIFEQMQRIIRGASNSIRRIGYTSEPEKYMQAADLFCLPSYREGFGSSVIEAASCGLPSLVSRIYGLTDAVVEGDTGWMHEPGDADDLLNKLTEILSNPEDMKKKSRNAQAYVTRYFEQSQITGKMLDFYIKRLRLM
jgi:glycosyltransferase involved in cell wall biosynthesis